MEIAPPASPPQSLRMSRRSALGALGFLGLASCGGGSGDAGRGSTTSTATGDDSSALGESGTSTTVSCVLIPEEVVGPYPLFTTIAAASAYQRQDITEGHGGVPLRLTLRVVNVNAGCAAITDARCTSGIATRTAGTPCASPTSISSDGTQYQMCAVSANATTGGYDAILTVGIAA